MQKAKCPHCGKDVALGSHPIVGKIFECEGCGAELEVLWLDPIELDWSLIDDEDDFDDFEDD